MTWSIIYFSGTGNTQWVAKCLQEALANRGEQVMLNSVEALPEAALNADHLLLGYPIYGSKAPRIMEAFLHNLPPAQSGQKVSVFTTVAYASGDGPVFYKTHLENKGYTFVYSDEFKLSNNFYIPEFPRVFPVGDADKIKHRNTKAKKRSETFVEALIASKKRLKGNHLVGRSFGNTQRKHIDAYISKLSNMFYADGDRCTACGLCVKLCPADNIALKDGTIHFGSQCMACMRCYHFCPTEAVNITTASLDAKKYPRFRGATPETLGQLIKIRRHCGDSDVSETP